MFLRSYLGVSYCASLSQLLSELVRGRELSAQLQAPVLARPPVGSGRLAEAGRTTARCRGAADHEVPLALVGPSETAPDQTTLPAPCSPRLPHPACRFSFESPPGTRVGSGDELQRRNSGRLGALARPRATGAVPGVRRCEGAKPRAAFSLSLSRAPLSFSRHHCRAAPPQDHPSTAAFHLSHAFVACPLSLNPAALTTRPAMRALSIATALLSLSATLLRQADALTCPNTAGLFRDAAGTPYCCDGIRLTGTVPPTSCSSYISPDQAVINCRWDVPAGTSLGIGEAGFELAPFFWWMVRVTMGGGKGDDVGTQAGAYGM